MVGEQTLEVNFLAYGCYYLLLEFIIFLIYRYLVILKLSLIKNVEADSLTVSASLFQIPEYPKEKYQIEVKHRPSIPDNVDHWQVFEDDE